MFTLRYEPAAAEAGSAAPVTASSADGGVEPELPAPFTCPITHLRCDRHPFAALRPCGHVFSERALKELAGGGGCGAGSAGTAGCPTCGTAYSAADDVIALYPDGQQLERLRELLPMRRQQQKQQRKKRKREPATAADAAQQSEQQEQPQPQQQPQQQKEQSQQQQAADVVP